MKKSMRLFKGIPEVYRLSSAGLRTMHQKLRSMQAERAEVAERLKNLKDQQPTNDPVENVIWAEQINLLQFLDRQLNELKNIIARAKPIRKPKRLRTVELGCRVKLAGFRGKTQSYTIVTSLEANPSEGKISDQSPLGQALLGRMVSESIDFSPNPTKIQPMKLRLLSID